MPERTTAVEAERLFQGLSDLTRLRLLNLMGEQEVCVCYFVEILGVSQPTISRHLAYLRRAGLVAARREGKWMHYRIVVPENQFARQLLNATLRWLADDKQMKHDRLRLSRACCAPQKFVSLERAPTPIPFTKLISDTD